MKFRNLFQNLKQGDPQAVAAVSVIVFFGTVVWFSWYLYSAAQISVPEMGGGRPPAPQPTPTPFSTFVLAQQEMALGENPPNPFHLRHVRQRPPRQPRPERQPPPQRPDPPPRPEPPPRAEPPPPPRETVTYEFRGMLRRPDGTRVAQVRNVTAGTSLFVAAGAELPPLTVAGVEMDRIELSIGDDTPVFLERGESQTFELP